MNKINKILTLAITSIGLCSCKNSVDINNIYFDIKIPQDITISYNGTSYSATWNDCDYVLNTNYNGTSYWTKKNTTTKSLTNKFKQTTEYFTQIKSDDESLSFTRIENNKSDYKVEYGNFTNGSTKQNFNIMYVNSPYSNSEKNVISFPTSNLKNIVFQKKTINEYITINETETITYEKELSCEEYLTELKERKSLHCYEINYCSTKDWNNFLNSGQSISFSSLYYAEFYKDGYNSSSTPKVSKVSNQVTYNQYFISFGIK